METAKWEKVIEMLVDKIASLETANYVLSYENDKLKEEIARLNELLTPTAKVGADNE